MNPRITGKLVYVSGTGVATIKLKKADRSKFGGREHLDFKMVEQKGPSKEEMIDLIEYSMYYRRYYLKRMLLRNEYMI